MMHTALQLCIRGKVSIIKRWNLF